MTANLRFLHLCERFWIQQGTGKYDIIGCFDRFNYHIIRTKDGECVPFRAPPFFVAVGLSGLHESCVCHMTIAGPETVESSPKVICSDSLLLNHVDPLGLNILAFFVKDLSIPVPGRYIIETSLKSVSRDVSVSVLGLRVLIANGVECSGERG